MSRAIRLLAGLVLVAAGAVAQPEAAPGRPAREEAFRMVDAYLVSNLQESLDLSDDQFAKAIPLVKKLQRERREHLLERARVMREMRRLLRQGGSPESPVLDLLQQAKYRVLEGEVEQRVRELSSRARAARPGTRQRSAPEPEP